MFIIQAPHPLSRDTLIIPSPELGNSVRLASTVTTQRTRSGKLFTYVKSKRGRKGLSWDFVVTFDKSREVKEFFRKHNTSLVRIIDHNETARVGYVTINPVELRAEGNDAYSFSLLFEEKV